MNFDFLESSPTYFRMIHFDSLGYNKSDELYDKYPFRHS